MTTLFACPVHLLECILFKLPILEWFFVACACQDFRQVLKHANQRRLATARPLPFRTPAITSVLSIERILWLQNGPGCPTWLCQEKWAEYSCKHVKHVPATSYAAQSGNLDVLTWLLENGCPMAINTFHSAAKGGHLIVLKWLKETWFGNATNAFPLNDSCACFYAAKHGQWDALKWLVANGHPLDYRTFNEATKRGTPDLLNWLEANGCQWDVEAFDNTAQIENPEILEWLRAKGRNGVA